MARKKESSAAEAAPVNKRKARVSQADVPRHTLPDALRIAQVLNDEFAKRPTKPFYIADALGISPTSSQFRTLTGAAVAYGLTTGAYNSPEIDLTELGRRAVSPLAEGDDVLAAREALLQPRVIREFLERYKDHPIPSDRIARNILEDLGVDGGATERTLGFIREGARDVGLIRTVQGKDWVDLTPGGTPIRQSASGADPVSPPEEEDPDELEPAPEGTTPPAPEPEPESSAAVSELTANRKVFITHGKNKKIVAQLKEMLEFGQFEPVVSVERESVSKPVPEKVLDDMRSCAAAIIHVGTEQRLRDSKGDEHRVINPNVLIEIGAAMMRYGGKFILLVEQGTELPSNLQGLYEVRYEGDVLDNPATMKLLRAFNEFK